MPKRGEIPYVFVIRIEMNFQYYSNVFNSRRRRVLKNKIHDDENNKNKKTNDVDKCKNENIWVVVIKFRNNFEENI